MTPDSMYETGREAEETLRLVAQLPPPDELTDRVHGRLAAVGRERAARRPVWSLWMPARRLQFVGAALLAAAVAGSTWGVYHRHPQSGVQTGTQGSGERVVPHLPQGSFGSAGAERVPPTLAPIKVPPSPKKKPKAGVIKASKPAAQSGDADAPQQSAVKPQ